MGQMRRGLVIQGRGSQVKVQFEDGLISPWLDVAQDATIGRQTYTRFRAGELVRCYLDRHGESGEVLHAIYTQDNPPPADSDEVEVKRLSDGSVLELALGLLRYTNAQGTVFEIVGPDVIITGNLKVSGDLSVEGQTDLKDTKINGVAQSGN